MRLPASAPTSEIEFPNGKSRILRKSAHEPVVPRKSVRFGTVVVATQANAQTPTTRERLTVDELALDADVCQVTLSSVLGKDHVAAESNG